MYTVQNDLDRARAIYCSLLEAPSGLANLLALHRQSRIIKRLIKKLP